MDLEKKAFFYQFLTLLQHGDVEAMGQKIDQSHFGEFGVFPSKTMIPLFLFNSASNFQRKSPKIEIMIIRYFILFFAFFSKTIELSSVFNEEINSTCQNTLLTTFLWDLEKKGVFYQFLPLLQYGDMEAMGQKLINTISAKLASFHLKTMIPLFLRNSASNV